MQNTPPQKKIQKCTPNTLPNNYNQLLSKNLKR